MLKLFGQTDKAFNSNGDRVIHALRARIKKEDNGEFYLELETDLSYANDITEGRIIIAPTPQGEQPFRIGNVTKTKNRISTKCLHVFFDSRNYLIADSYVVDKNCNDALDHLNNATEPVSEFTTISDVPIVNSYRCVRTSLYEAIQTVIERWGGHLDLNGFEIGIRQNIGQDNGVVVRYAKNLKDITVEENWDEIIALDSGDEPEPTESYVQFDLGSPTPLGNYINSVSFSNRQQVGKYPLGGAWWITAVSGDEYNINLGTGNLGELLKITVDAHINFFGMPDYNPPEMDINIVNGTETKTNTIAGVYDSNSKQMKWQGSFTIDNAGSQASRAAFPEWNLGCWASIMRYYENDYPTLQGTIKFEAIDG